MKRQRIEFPLICIVDDDGSVVEATVSLVESIGYIAKGFRSAEDFLKSPQLPNTDCLILDIRMPSMDGFELQRRLAACAMVALRCDCRHRSCAPSYLH